jgi:bacterioferritin
VRHEIDLEEELKEGTSLADRDQQIIQELIRAYEMELETVENYMANSINLDGVRAEEIKKSLLADITGEIGHAQLLGNRIKQLDGVVPGSLSLRRGQEVLQPPKDSTDLVFVIKGVISAEESAIAQYRKIVDICDGYDYVTQDLAITLMSDEENHRREFRGFLKEYEKG